MSNHTFKKNDFTLEINSKEFHVIHHQNSFNITGQNKPTQINVPVASSNGLQIILNINTKAYYVVNQLGQILNFQAHYLPTLSEAIQFANNYLPEKILPGRLTLKRFFEDAKKGMKLKLIYSSINHKADDDFMPVSKIQTNGLYIIRNGKQSYLVFTTDYYSIFYR